MDTVKGSCLCEAITFDIQGQPENVLQCFCTHCAKNAGAPYQYVRITTLDRGCFLNHLTVEIDQVAKFKVEQVQVTDSKGALKTYTLNDTTSGFDKHKVFCGVCGCTLWTIPMRHGGTHYIVRTSLIDNGLQLFPPQVVFFASRDKSQESREGLKRFSTMPGFDG